MRLRIIKSFVKFPINLTKRAPIFVIRAFRRYVRIKPLNFIGGVEAHVLVVKKREYARIAKICVESFCFYNDSSRVTIYVDSVTESSVRKELSRLIKRGRVSIKSLFNEDKWQIQKIDLIFSLIGTKDIFMDADLKWNAPLPELKNVTFFVREYEIDKEKDLGKIIASAIKSSGQLGSMKNTSFFTWSGYEPERNLLTRVLKLEKDIHEFATAASNFSSSWMARMSEQLALSLAVEEIEGLSIDYLKSADGFKDGTFVESSYFGATGATF